MTYNKTDWVRDFEEKCREEFLDGQELAIRKKHSGDLIVSYKYAMV